MVPTQHEPTDHVNGCPLKTRMDTVEDHVAGQAVAAKRDKGWLDRMWPLIYVLAGVAFYLALIHAGELLNMWKPWETHPSLDDFPEPQRRGARRGHFFVWDDGVMGTFVYPFRSDHVWLRARRQTWKSLAPRIKRTLSDAAKNIVTIREAIAADAQVHSMPPVEIVAEHWAHGNSFISGRMTPLERGTAWEIGVQLPASTAVHYDPTLIRSILVHEFAHCFFLMQKCVRDGESRDSHNVFDDSADRARMADPRDWFGAEDVERFCYHDDPALDELEQNSMDLAGLLPLVDPDLRYSVKGTLHYPTDVRDRIEELLRREQG